MKDIELWISATPHLNIIYFPPKPCFFSIHFASFLCLTALLSSIHSVHLFIICVAGSFSFSWQCSVGAFHFVKNTRESLQICCHLFEARGLNHKRDRTQGRKAGWPYSVGGREELNVDYTILWDIFREPWHCVFSLNVLCTTEKSFAHSLVMPEGGK